MVTQLTLSGCSAQGKKERGPYANVDSTKQPKGTMPCFLIYSRGKTSSRGGDVFQGTSGVNEA